MGLHNKLFFEAAGPRNGPPGTDAVAVISLADPAHPRITGTLTLDNSVAGPPTNLQITPDGSRAWIAKNGVHKVGVLTVNGTEVTYDKRLDMPVGLGVYHLDVTPDGTRVIAANTGIGSDGHAKTVSVIDATANPPRVVDHVTVGDSPEGFAIAPDGRHAVAVLLRGTSARHDAWSYTKTGAAVLLRIEDGRVRVTGQAEAGNLPEGVAFSPDSQYVYIANYAGRTMQVFRIEGDAIRDTGTVLDLPGQPASLRGVAR